MEALTRRRFVLDLGRVGFGIAVLGAAAACGSDDPAGDAGPASGGAAAPSQTPGPGATANLGSPAPAADGALAFNRVDLGFVSAWILVRNGQAALVDTGVAGSLDAIEAGLRSVGLGFGDVSDVVITHRHPDHQGSVPEVLAAATGAAAWAGAADLAAITSPREVGVVGDGDRVFGMDIIETPGHTAGHISVHDPVAGILVTGDALNGANGGVVGANPDFSEDMGLAEASVARLAQLRFEQALFGHGEPVLSGADAAVRALVART